jgi:hypothetical protein
MSVIGKNYGKPTLDLNFAGNKSLIDTITRTNYVTFTRAQSGNEATYVGSDGLIKYASADEPRFDHDPETLESLGLLIEEQRTNLVRNSSNLGTISDTRQITITPDATISPDGITSNAKLFTPTIVNTEHRFSIESLSGITVLTDVPYTLSLFVKSNGYEQFTLLGHGGNTDGGSYQIDLATSASNIKKLPNGWFRVNVTFIYSTTTQVNPTIRIGYGNFAGDGTSGIYIWGAQLEAGAFPTSYIPTSGSTETRSADVASITGTNFTDFYNQSEWTMFCEYSSFSFSNSASLSTMAHFTDGTLNEYIRLNCAPSYKLRSFIVDGGVTQTQINTGGTSSNNEIVRSVAGIQENNVKIVVNGNTSNTETNVTLPSPTKVEIGNWISQANTFLNGHISRLTYYPKRLPDIELQQLTK